MHAEVFNRSRWLAPSRGVAAGAFGMLIVSWPHLSLARLAALFGAYALVEGALTVIGAGYKPLACADWKLIRLQGLASIAIGIIVFGRPGITASYLMLQIVLRAAAIGGIDSIVGLLLLAQTRRARLLLLAGIVPALVEALALARFGVGALAVQWSLSISSITVCVLLITLTFRLRAPARAMLAA
jgi:uncharacterized membrane protein HdeD (DUF308 family)